MRLSSMKMSIIEGRRRLALLWGSGSFLALLVLIVEIYGKVWGSVAPEAFGWCLLMVMPSLILIAGSVVAEQAQKKPSRPEAMSLAFWLTFWVSVSYLAFVTIAVVAAAWDEKPISVLKTSSLWLLPLQALIGGSIMFGGRLRRQEVVRSGEGGGSHIFISYSRSDAGYAKKLAQALEDEGFAVWNDYRIGLGTSWPRVIQEQLDDSSAVIVLMTPRAYQSEWVQNELSRAKRKQKAIFPLLLEGMEPWLSVESTQYLDVTDGRLPPRAFYELLAKAVSSRVASISSGTPISTNDAQREKTE
jgi:hypothetical protein